MGRKLSKESVERLSKSTRLVERSTSILHPYLESGNVTPRPVDDPLLPIVVFTSGGAATGRRMERTTEAWFRVIIDEFFRFGPTTPSQQPINSYQLDSIQLSLKDSAAEAPIGWMTVPERQEGSDLAEYQAEWYTALLEVLKLHPAYDEDTFASVRHEAVVQFSFGTQYTPSINNGNREQTLLLFNKAKLKQVKYSSSSKKYYYGPPSPAVNINPFYLTCSNNKFDPDGEIIELRHLDAVRTPNFYWSTSYVEALCYPTEYGDYVVVNAPRRYFPIITLDESGGV